MMVGVKAGFSALLLAFATARGVSAQGMMDFTPFDPQSMDRAARLCASDPQAGHTDPDRMDLCLQIFLCGEAGCQPHRIVVVVARDFEPQMRELAARLPLEGFTPCDPAVPEEKEYVDLFATEYVPWGLDGFIHRFRDVSYRSYCGSAEPGYDADIALAFRQLGGDKIAAIRLPQGAGLPPAQVTLTLEQFAKIRESYSLPLRAPVVAALEVLTGVPCETTDRITCSVVAERGKLKVDLLFPDGALTGRQGHWERAYMEIYPSNPGGYFYDLAFDMPISSVRRWPADRPKPGLDTLQALDWDDGFMAFRTSVMSIVSDRLDDALNGGD